MTKKAKELKNSYIIQLKEQYSSKLLTDTPVIIDIKIYFGDKRTRDVDNYSKLLFDSLIGIILVDDSLIYKMSVEKFYDKGKPRIDLEIDQYICKTI